MRAPVGTIVKKMLEIDNRLRYANATDLLDDLKTELPAGFALDESMLVSLSGSARREIERKHDPMELAATVLKDDA